MHRSPPSRRGALSPVLAILIAIVLVLLVAGGCVAAKYNDLVGRRETVDAAWSALESDYQRRAELVPQLVATVRGASDFESETLTAVTEARARATSIRIEADDLDDPARLEEFLAAQQQLGSALGRLIATAEAYPELKSVEAFRDLQVQLEGTENRINQSRKDYVREVRDFNTAVRRFPGNLIAGAFGFERLPQLEVEESATEPPVVDFSDE